MIPYDWKSTWWWKTTILQTIGQILSNICNYICTRCYTWQPCYWASGISTVVVLVSPSANINNLGKAGTISTSSTQPTAVPVVSFSVESKLVGDYQRVVTPFSTLVALTLDVGLCSKIEHIATGFSWTCVLAYPVFFLIRKCCQNCCTFETTGACASCPPLSAAGTTHKHS